MGFDLNLALGRTREGKALPYNPAFADATRPVGTYSPGYGQPARSDSVVSQREALRHADAYGGRQAIDWVYDCIGLYSDPASTAPFKLQHVDGTKLVDKKVKGTPPDHEIGPQDLYRLLTNPNPYMLYDELMSLLVIDLLLVGNAYWFKWQMTADGKPLALYRLAPGYVKVVPDQFGPKRYEYQPPGAAKPLKISPEQIIHFRRPNPHSAYYGMGVIQGAGRSMDLEIAVTETMAAYYENKADPSLIVESERRVPRDVFNKLRAQLRARVAGPNRAGELLVLENGLKANTLTASARDALFAELGKMSQDRIYSKFRASRKLFGYQDTTGQDKVSDIRRDFDNATLRPFLSRLGKQVSASLTAAWGVDYIIDHQTLLPVDEATKVAGQIAAVPGIKVREVRAQYRQFGIEESTGDPKIDEMVLNLPTPQADANGMVTDPVTGQQVRADAVGADRNLPGEPGRPPKGENTRAIGNASGKALTIDAIEARLASMGAGKAVSTPAPDNRLPGEDRFAGARQADIDEATSQMAADLREAVVELERGLLDTLEGKALKTSDIVKRVRSSKAWATFKTRVQKILEEGAHRAALSGVMHTGKTPEDEIDYEAIVASVVHRPEGLRSILNTVRDRVAKRIKEARDRDGERHDYESAVRAALAEWADSQAVAIADSEATEAYNEATLTTLEAVGETDVFVHEEADAPDDACQEARGQIWPIDHARQHRKEHPRCRRAFLSVAQADAEVA